MHVHVLSMLAYANMHKYMHSIYEFCISDSVSVIRKQIRICTQFVCIPTYEHIRLCEKGNKIKTIF